MCDGPHVRIPLSKEEREKVASGLELAVAILKEGLYARDEWAEEMLERWYANIPEEFKRHYWKSHGLTDDMDDG